jgi:hypothetical protein
MLALKLLCLAGIAAIIVLCVMILKKVDKCNGMPKMGYAASGRFANPGCDPDEQAKCTAMIRDPSNPQCNGTCVACNDYEGEGCVPVSCKATACM